jgi:hypothetical protein
MKYSESNRDVRVGDEVLYDGCRGLVVYIVDDDSYSDRYPKEFYSVLGSGFGVEWQEGAVKGQVCHFTSSEDDEDLLYFDATALRPDSPGTGPPLAGGGGPA